MNTTETDRVHFIEISTDGAGQRVDNFIRKRYPGLPKGRIYQMLRKGEVRINKKRAKPTQKLAFGDLLRLPPIIDGERERVGVPVFWKERIAKAVLYEDEDFLILDKPAGIAVHGGSGQEFGVIDAVRALWGEGYAELAHRLDRETSGVLVLGKRREALAGFQQLMQEGKVEKRYWTLVSGAWDAQITEVRVQLSKGQSKNIERMQVSESGKWACSGFHIVRSFASATLLEVLLDTGRTHQIRVSVEHQGHGIAGDEKYGDAAFNCQVKALGFSGLFLHAREIRFEYGGKNICVQAKLPQSLQQLLDRLNNT